MDGELPESVYDVGNASCFNLHGIWEEFSILQNNVVDRELEGVVRSRALSHRVLGPPRRPFGGCRIARAHQGTTSLRRAGGGAGRDGGDGRSRAADAAHRAQELARDRAGAGGAGNGRATAAGQTGLPLERDRDRRQARQARRRPHRFVDGAHRRAPAQDRVARRAESSSRRSRALFVRADAKEGNRFHRRGRRSRGEPHLRQRPHRAGPPEPPREQHQARARRWEHLDLGPPVRRLSREDHPRRLCEAARPRDRIRRSVPEGFRERHTARGRRAINATEPAERPVRASKGLGLVIAKRLVRLHGGSLVIEESIERGERRAPLPARRSGNRAHRSAVPEP